jgi:sugar lactone lactonase YvrE
MRALSAILTVFLSLALVPLAHSQPLTFNTLAGNAGQGSAGGSGGNARFNLPGGIAADGAGNVYVADTANHTVRKISGGVVSTVAGLAGASGSADGKGSAARFNQPQGVVVAANGIVYVADTGNHTIRKVALDGTVTTLAGAAGNPGALNATGTNAQFYEPEAVAVKSDGSLIYVADTWNHTIRQITSAGVVTTLAGLAGTPGSTNGTGSGALFYQPQGVAVDGAGSVYVGDTANGTIRKVTAGGVVTTLAGSAGTYGSVNGSGSGAQFYQPMGVAVDTNGTVYVADNFNHTIRAVTSAGAVSTLAGSAGVYGSTDGTGGNARFYSPQAVAVSGTTVYVADTGNGTIRQISSGGVTTTLAGSVSAGSADGPGASARFYWPKGVAFDGGGNAYVADTFNHTIRRITSGGVVSTLAGTAGNHGSNNGTGGSAQFYAPQGMATDADGNVYVADTANNTVRQVTSGGVVTTLAGTAGVAGLVDGIGTSAQFNQPQAVAVDNSNNAYVADTGNHSIRKISPGGGVTTLAGLPGYAGSIDGTGPSVGTNTARFSSPAGLAVDSAGNVYVADTGNHTIRCVTPAGVVSTLAGLPGVWGNADGTNRAARFFQPQGIIVDGQGNLFVMDSGNHTVRMIAPSGTDWVVSTVAGQPDLGGSADGTGGGAQFYYPGGIGFNSSGVFAVADSGNNTIRAGQPPIAHFDRIITLPNGSVQLNMSGAPNTTYTLLGSANLTGWNTLAILPSGSGSFQYTDPSAATNGARFYRLRLGP